MVHGARVSLMIGVVSTLVALLIGVPLGAVAGYAGGFVDDALMRFTEFFQTIPSFALAIVLVGDPAAAARLDRARHRRGVLASGGPARAR